MNFIFSVAGSSAAPAMAIVDRKLTIAHLRQKIARKLGISVVDEGRLRLFSTDVTRCPLSKDLH
ncbi:hypothetical protein PC116_g1650 [Phytophthora cactorum]|nr:hypothetical protein PC114_g988 [Phytophthora cactorum]KAG3192447.1 hypothetical protein C6341_g624 [Phytophthora cactorum]KAG4250684.1 hypothetical protein PC116_g1650 [Phytophthora cactorum]